MDEGVMDGRWLDIWMGETQYNPFNLSNVHMIAREEDEKKR